MPGQENNWYDKIATDGKLDTTNKLLVPMSLRAMVFTGVVPGLFWKDITPVYDNFNNPETCAFLGRYLEADPCGIIDKTFGPSKGIHLHWTLPKAFRHGIQNEKAPAPEFPLVPNRWLITRTHVEKDTGQAGNPKIYTRHWIIESDRVSEPGDTPNYLLANKKSATAPLSPADSLKTVKIGKVSDAAGWNETAASRIKLTIVAPGDPGYAAFYSSCEGIFGFHDDLITTPVKADHCSYTVSGWYADPKDDILSVADAKKWLEKIKELGWEITDPGATGDINLPVSVLCHAMIQQVPCGENPALIWDTPVVSNINIGIGNSSAEALAPLMINNIAGKDQVLKEAFDPLLASYQYKLVTEHGNSKKGRDVLKRQIHNNEFHAENGGIVWTVENKEKQAGPENAGNENNTPPYLPFPGKISALLAELNALQYKYNKDVEILYSLQEELYAAWYIKAWLNTQDGPDEEKKTGIAQKVNAEMEKIKNKLQAYKTIPASPDGTFASGFKEAGKLAIEKKKTELNNELEKYPSLNYELKESRMPPYYLPNEPAIVMDGLKPLMAFDEKGNLACRFHDQVIKMITYPYPDIDPPATVIIPAVSGNDKGLDSYLNAPLLNNSSIPGEAILIIKEAMLLDPAINHLKAIVASINIGGVSSDQRIADLERSIQNKLADPAHPVFNDSLAPPSFASVKWTQPWNPLYAEWEIEWLSSYDTLTTEKIFADWKYDFHSEDYRNSKTRFQTSNENASTYRGRIPLSSGLTGKVNDIFSSIPALEKISYLFQPVSQILSGLNNNFVTLESGLQLPPVSGSPDGISGVIDNIILDIDDQYLWRPMPGAKDFFPVRSGYFRIRNLFIIDSFGRLLDVVNSSDKKRVTRLSVSSNMQNISIGEESYIVAPPRLAHPARLRFNWISADNDLRETDSDPGTSPVCGWLLPNKLDRSLMVFDKDGDELCELKTVAGDQHVRWNYPPGQKSNPDLDIFLNQIRNITLRSVVSSLIKTDAQSFNELYEIIDNKSKTGVPKSQFRPLSMELPIGMPVAIAKASCRLEIKGLPPRDWISLKDDSGLSQLKFPVFLGNSEDNADGLIGFFTNNNYEQINTAFAYSNSNRNPYFISGNNPPVTIGSDTGAAPAQPLVLLMDPRLSINVASGFLPTAQYELPVFGISRIMEKINFSFLVSPVLTRTKRTDLPLKEIKDKEWVWIANSDTGNIRDEEKLNPGSTNILNYDPLHLTEGWLKLIPKNKP
jgi:hypothetical protein